MSLLKKEWKDVKIKFRFYKKMKFKIVYLYYMDIKNIFRNFSSSVSNPNIVEHFNTEQQEEVLNEDVYDDFIDKLVQDKSLSESEKKSLLRIKERGD